MTTEIFQGAPKELKDRLDTLIGLGAATLQVVALEKSWYLIIYS